MSGRRRRSAVRSGHLSLPNSWDPRALPGSKASHQRGSCVGASGYANHPTAVGLDRPAGGDHRQWPVPPSHGLPYAMAGRLRSARCSLIPIVGGSSWCSALPVFYEGCSASATAALRTMALIAVYDLLCFSWLWCRSTSKSFWPTRRWASWLHVDGLGSRLTSRCSHLHPRISRPVCSSRPVGAHSAPPRSTCA